MLPFPDALARVLALAAPPLAERVALPSALGRVLHAPLLAPSALPPFTHSSMDGYALRAADAGVAPCTLRVVSESRTGAPLPGPLEQGECCRIFTGARLPEGADAVVMQEHVTREGELASFAKAPSAGQFVRLRGADLEAGAVALRAGLRLGPAQLALAASLDCTALAVARRPVVAVLSTGDELREPGAPGPEGSVPDCNAVALAGLCERAGATALLFPRVPDEREALSEALGQALAVADLVLTVGGVSVGDHDHVRAALDAQGVHLDFWRVAVKPGKPLAVGRKGRSVVLGLPGNPASAMVTFHLFAAPLLRAMQGALACTARVQRLPLAHAVTHETGRLELARAVFEGDRVRLLGTQASGSVPSMAWADVLVWLDADRAQWSEGELVRCTELSDG